MSSALDNIRRYLMRSDRSREGIRLNREDTERRDQLARSVRRVRISRSLLGLAWTAGPVTALGLYTGYYIGFGYPPSRELLIYFISFTVFSGLMAIAAKVFYDTTWGHASERAQRHVTEVTDKLANLILAVRNLTVDGLEEDVRVREAAIQLLQRVDLPPAGIAKATRQLTGDEELGQLLADIDSYRRAGLYSRIRDIHDQTSEQFEAVIARIQPIAPVAAEVLRLRYTGEIARLRDGMPRSEDFIAKVLAATEQDDMLLITMKDVEAMLILAFELICGREIPMLIFSYRGRWRLAAALDRMERKRSRYRIAQASSSSRIRSLASWLVEVGVTDYETVPEGMPSTQLVERVVEILDSMSEELAAQAEAMRAGKPVKPVSLRGAADVMATALRLYRKAYEASARIGDLHADFLEAADEWTRLLDRTLGVTSELQVGPRGSGVHILEKVVRLEDEERKEVCQHLAQYMRAEYLETQENKALFERRSERENPLTADSARRLAVEVGLALEPHVHLSYPEIQRGVGATLATYLGDLEPGMSATEKKLLGEAMATDVLDDTSQAAEQLALALVRHYRVNLSEDARRFLHDTYGARESVLEIIGQYQSGSGQVAQSPLAARPVGVPSAPRRWYRSLVLARRLVGDVR